MDNLEEAKRIFEKQAYEVTDIYVDKLSETMVRRILKRLLGIAADSGNMKYIAACREIINKQI